MEGRTLLFVVILWNCHGQIAPANWPHSGSKERLRFHLSEASLSFALSSRRPTPSKSPCKIAQTNSAGYEKRCRARPQRPGWRVGSSRTSPARFADRPQQQVSSAGMLCGFMWTSIFDRPRQLILLYWRWLFREEGNQGQASICACRPRPDDPPTTEPGRHAGDQTRRHQIPRPLGVFARPQYRPPNPRIEDCIGGQELRPQRTGRCVGDRRPAQSMILGH